MIEDMAKRDQQHDLRMVTVDEYQDAAARTRDKRRVGYGAEQYALLSIKGEIGELCEVAKKWWYHGQEKNAVRLMDEMGDVLWSCAELCTVQGVRLRNLLMCDDWSEYQSYRVTHNHPRALLMAMNHTWGAEGVVDSLARLCAAWGLELAEVAARNVAKLAARYPDGYVSGGGVR